MSVPMDKIGQEPGKDPTGVAVAPAPIPEIDAPPPTGGPPVAPASNPVSPSYQQMQSNPVRPATRYQRQDEIEADRKKAEHDYSLMEQVSAGLQLENTIAAGMRYEAAQAQKPNFESDPTHVTDPKALIGYEDHWESFIDSQSPQEDEWIKSQIDEDRRLREVAG